MDRIYICGDVEKRVVMMKSERRCRRKIKNPKKTFVEKEIEGKNFTEKNIRMVISKSTNKTILVMVIEFLILETRMFDKFNYRLIFAERKVLLKY